LRILNKDEKLKASCNCHLKILKPSQFIYYIKQFLAIDESVNKPYSQGEPRTAPQKLHDVKRVTKVRYQNFIINAVPDQLADTGEWTTHLYIEHYSDYKFWSMPFTGEKTFQTKDEAIQNCFILGEQIIDGNVDNCNAPY
jgi:hypothetical protein